MTPLTKRLAVALAVSVALNLMLAGFWLGRALDRRYHRSHAAEFGGHGSKVMRDRALRQILGEGKVDFRSRRDATRAARGSIRAALEAEPFDRQRLSEALARLRGETQKSQEELHEALIGAAEKGGADTRRRLGEAFSGERKRRR